MSPAGSRKRPAPGSSPLVQQQQPTLATNLNTSALQMSADQNLQWHQAGLANTATTGYPDQSSNFATNMYNGSMQQDTSKTASNQVARRGANHHVVSRGTFNPGDDSWPLLPDDTLPQGQDPNWLNPTDDLEHKAQIARRDTQAKRKQIPPFVQKLSR